MSADSVGGRLDGGMPGDIDSSHPGNNNHHGSSEGEPTFSDDDENEENDVENEVEENDVAAGSLVRSLRRLSQDDDEDEDIPLGKNLTHLKQLECFLFCVVSLLWSTHFELNPYLCSQSETKEREKRSN